MIEPLKFIETVIDLRRDVKSILRQLESIELAEALDTIRMFNEKMRDINIKEMLTTIKRLNTLLSKIDFCVLNNLGSALNETDIKEMVKGVKMMQELLSAVGKSELVE